LLYSVIININGLNQYSSVRLDIRCQGQYQTDQKLRR